MSDGMRTTLQIGELETLPPSNVVANFPFKIDCVTRYVIKCKPSGVNFVGKRWGGLHSNAGLCLDEKFSFAHVPQAHDTQPCSWVIRINSRNGPSRSQQWDTMFYTC